MPFQRTGQAPERIMLYGEPNSGKSTAIFNIARKLLSTGSPAKVHLIDTDNAFFDMIDEYPDCEQNVLPIFVDQGEEGGEWDELKEGIARGLKDADAARGDWICVDRADPAWEWVQDSFSREVKQKNIDDLRAEGRKQGADKNLRAGMSGFEWGEVKSRFRKPYSRLISSGCNVILTAGSTNISSFTDPSGETSKMFGGLPWAPGGGAGSRLLAHMVRDIIHMRMMNASKGEFVMSAAKWRTRKKRVENEKVGDFSFTFLTRVANWRNTGNGDGEET